MLLIKFVHVGPHETIEMFFELALLQIKILKKHFESRKKKLPKSA